MMRTLFNLIVILCISVSAVAQPTNSWIQADQYYYKIGVPNDGVVRLSISDLSAAGVPVSSFSAENIQIIYKGNEIPVHVVKSGGVLNYLEFYGERNTGWFDVGMFDSITSQINPYYSQITDTAAYFLTWNNSTNNKRYAETAFNATDATVVNHGTSQALQMYTANMFMGEEFPEYNNAKGWFDNQTITLGNTRTKNLVLPGVQNTGETITIETAVVSFGDATAFGDNHHLQIELPGGTVFDTTFSGKTAVKKHFAVNTSALSESNNIIYRSIDDLNVAADNMTISHIQTLYPAAFDFTSQNRRTFMVEKSTSNQIITLQGIPESVTPLIYDTANHIKPSPQFNGTNWEFTLPPSAKNHYLIIQQAYDTPGYIKQANTTLPATTNSDYVIITHPNFVNGANNYAAYRNAAVITTDVLYNHFAWGLEKHPLAIRNYLKYYHSSTDTLPQYVLLIGKARSINLSRKNTTNHAFTFVPTMGYPASDNLMATHITKNSYKTEVAISRLAVQSNQEINNYLDKVQALENQPPAQWMKNVVHFGGGNNETEQTTFANYLDNFKNIIEDTLMGARVSTFLKNSSDPIQITSSDSIKSLINNGSSLLTFFGHGYSDGFDQDIDEPSAYNNLGKYPMMLANSCYSGNIHTQYTGSASEKWVLIPNKGAIAFLASVFQGYPSLLNDFSGNFYKNLAVNNYGQGLGMAVKMAIAQQVESSSSLLGIGTALNFTLHGDPAVVLNQYDEPDIILQNNLAEVQPAQVSTVIDSFAVKFIATNIGKTITGEINYQVEHTLPDGSDSIFTISRNGIFFQDTITTYLQINRQNGAGLNIIRITADYLNIYPELDEFNNSLEIPVNVKSTSLFPVYPYPFAINARDSLVLRASTGDPFINEVYAKIEIDTTSEFNSPFKRTIEKYFSGGVIEWNPQIAAAEGQTYFWRTGTRDENDQFEWVQKSFTARPNEQGWTQEKHDQLIENDLQFIVPTSNGFAFQEASNELFVQNIGSPSNAELGDIYFNLNNARTSGACGAGNFIVLAIIDSTEFQAWPADHGDYGHINYPQCYSHTYPHTQFVFYSNETALDNVIELINNVVPDGHFVLMYTISNGNFENWENRHFEAFENMGAAIIRGVPNNYPYIFFGQKGLPDKAQEIAGDDPDDVITLTVDLKDNFDYGNIITDWIGPANSWNSISWAYNENLIQAEDSIHIDVLSKNESAKSDHVLFGNISHTSTPFDLSTVNANEHPYLKLRFYTRDVQNKTPAYPTSITLKYEPKSDIAISPGDHFHFPKDSVQEGDQIALSLAYRNISDISSPATAINYRITNNTNETVAAQTNTISALEKNSSTNDTVKFETNGFNGYHTLWVEYRQNSAEDFFGFNNIGSLPFFVYGDETNPLLDVTFDGRHIMNGEIVSAQPTIKIQLTDENPYLSLSDTSLFALYLKREGDEEKRIYLGPGIANGTIIWEPEGNDRKASITYMPEFEKNGVYQLRVQARDASDNLSGINDYQIEFQIINESTITNIFNYPNPFSTSTRFVFTLTGNQIPDEFNIDIYTISGKLVRRIEMNELGPVYVGKNITEFAWDGTDEYGDRLANGVYLYKVTIRINGEKVDLRNTGTDGFFKKGWGKMYLMR
ncbi:putative type IX secretion system sortase PorU2 [Salinivirga cyanobacteriivorans]